METTIVREVLVNYKSTRKYINSETLRDPSQVSALLRKLIPDNSREHFMALYLDGSHKLIGYSTVTTGTANQTQIHPREIFQRAIMLGSIALIVAHNHPSERCEPSNEDNSMTENIKEASKLLMIKLLDHVVFTSKNYYSYQEHGRI